MIPFNKLYHAENELTFISEVLKSDRISGGGAFTQLCETFFEKRYNFKKALLTSSCTHSLEMSALLIDLKPGDEVIMPSYSFVSMANAFLLRGAKAVFADSQPHSPNIDPGTIEALITTKTKAIVVIHYGGIACEIDKIKSIAEKHNIYLIEDAAHCIDSYYNGRPLGSFGQLSAFSFHDTKNITCGEGGMLVINDDNFSNLAEIIREKGTNHTAFLKNQVSRYHWITLGSSFLASDISAAYLYAQFLCIDKIQEKRKYIWNRYYQQFKGLNDKGLLNLPYIPYGAQPNAHIFYFICNSESIKDSYIKYMHENFVMVRTHYLTLHSSPYYGSLHDGRDLPNATRYEKCLVRLPLFPDLTNEEVNLIIKNTYDFFIKHDE